MTCVHAVKIIIPCLRRKASNIVWWLLQLLDQASHLATCVA